MNIYSTISAVFLFTSTLFPSFGANDNAILFTNRIPDTSVSHPVTYWSETRENPRPINIHFLRIDTQNQAYEVFAMISDDPDGNGPADAKLEEPVKMAARHNALAAVNANGFRSLKIDSREQDSNWFIDKPVKITGLAVSNGVVRGKISSSHFSFWMGTDGKPYMGNPDNMAAIKEAITDWSGYLVHRGKIITSNQEKLHPRTLVGIDKSNRWLFLVVVDGRQPEVSEGVNLLEAANLMRSLGCEEAMAMDGGGSSIILARDPSSDSLKIMNNPSSEKPRPIPVMLGVRRRL